MRPTAKRSAEATSKQEGDALCADALKLMQTAFLMAQTPLDPISQLCPPELRYDYRGT